MSSIVHVVCPHCDAVNRAPGSKLKPGVSGKCGQCGRALFEGRPLPLSADRFTNHAGKGDLPLLVDFWAAWCGPCRMMAPAFEQAASRLEPKVRLAKVDTEAEPGLAQRFGIRSIPTLLMIRAGREIARHAGAMDAAGIERWARQFL